MTRFDLFEQFANALQIFLGVADIFIKLCPAEIFFLTVLNLFPQVNIGFKK